MKLSSITTTLVLTLLVGCRGVGPKPPEPRRDMWVGDAIRAASMNQAIVSQSTLYPYHFVHGAAALNELGQRDLAVLADHFVQYPGSLNVVQGGVSVELYTARIDAVTDALVIAGVGEDRFTVTNGRPGGSGITSSRAIEILEAEREAGMQSLSANGALVDKESR